MDLLTSARLAQDHRRFGIPGKSPPEGPSEETRPTSSLSDSRGWYDVGTTGAVTTPGHLWGVRGFRLSRVLGTLTGSRSKTPTERVVKAYRGQIIRTPVKILFQNTDDSVLIHYVLHPFFV